MGKKIYIILITVIIASFLISKGIRSTKAINKTLAQGIEVIKNYTKLEEVDIGEYKKITLKKVFPLYTTAYKIENVGYLAILSFNIGIFQVFSFHLSPYDKDFPILIIDYMQYFWARRAIFEAYNTTIDKDNDLVKNFINEFEKLKIQYSDIKDWKRNSQWTITDMNKQGYDTQDNRFSTLFSDVINIYMKNIIKMPKLEGDLKTKKADLIKEFAEQMAKNGEIIGKMFKSEMKEEDVIKLFVDIFFGFAFK